MEKIEYALSIQQPWAWLIVNGHKDIENRVWKTDFRGRIWVHAGKKIDREGYNIISHLCPGILLPPLSLFNKEYHPTDLDANDLMRGGIIGSVDIVDCVQQSRSPWFFGPYGFVLANPAKREFFPMRGQLKIFFAGELK